MTGERPSLEEAQRQKVLTHSRVLCLGRKGSVFGPKEYENVGNDLEYWFFKGNPGPTKEVHSARLPEKSVPAKKLT